MDFNQIIVDPRSSRGKSVLLSEFDILKVDRSTQSVVFRVPRGDRGIGSPILLTTSKGEKYEGFIEVVSKADDSLICWCGVCFEPIMYERRNWGTL